MVNLLHNNHDECKGEVAEVLNLVDLHLLVGVIFDLPVD